MAMEAREDALWEQAGKEFEHELRSITAHLENYKVRRIVERIWEELPDDELALAIIAHELGIKTPRERVEALRLKITPSPEDEAMKEALEP